MAKFLNLDDLVEVEKEIQLGGITYPIVERSLGQVLKAIEASKKAEKNGDDENFILTIDFIQEAIPSCPRKELMKMPIASLQKLMVFINENEAIEDEEGKQ